MTHAPRQRRNERSPEKIAEIAEQVMALSGLKMVDLWEVWDRHFPSRPAHPNRAYLEARLAYRIQELAFGGLPSKTAEMLADYGQRFSVIQTSQCIKPVAMPGSTLIREFDGRQFQVQVLADGRYEFDGKVYRSLSAIAKRITGAHWSGPAFFGIKSKGLA